MRNPLISLLLQAVVNMDGNHRLRTEYSRRRMQQHCRVQTTTETNDNGLRW